MGFRYRSIAVKLSALGRYSTSVVVHYGAVRHELVLLLFFSAQRHLLLVMLLLTVLLVLLLRQVRLVQLMQRRCVLRLLLTVIRMLEVRLVQVMRSGCGRSRVLVRGAHLSLGAEIHHHRCRSRLVVYRFSQRRQVLSVETTSSHIDLAQVVPLEFPPAPVLSLMTPTTATTSARLNNICLAKYCSILPSSTPL